MPPRPRSTGNRRVAQTLLSVLVLARVALVASGQKHRQECLFHTAAPRRSHHNVGMFLIYGANGYTGELIAREAVRRGHRPILAGRDAAKIEPLARELGCEARAFGLDAADLAGVALVLHCAGPFSITSAPMVDACLRAGVHYLDITGEISVFESIMRRDGDAK